MQGKTGKYIRRLNKSNGTQNGCRFIIFEFFCDLPGINSVYQYEGSI